MRCRWRNSVAQRSTELAASASTVMNSAWRSRWTICVERMAGRSPSRAQTSSSTCGSRCARVPTAPLSLPTAMRGRISTSRSRTRPNSSYISAIFRPKVRGSAWMPWLRPIIGVSLCARACSAAAARTSSTPRISRSQVAAICTASVVSSTSEEVSPWCIQRAAGPTESATFSRKAITSWLVRFSISKISGRENFALSRMARASSAGICPSRAMASQASVSISSQISYLRWSDQSARISGREYRSITGAA